MWVLGLTIVAGLTWWQWPEITTIYDQTKKANAEAATQQAYQDKFQAEVKARDDMLKAKAKRIGYRAIIDPLLAKKRLNADEHSELGNAAGNYALELDAAGIQFDDNGYVRSVKGHEAYFAKVYKKATEPYDFDPPAPATATPASSPAPVAASWRTVVHFTGHSVKDTPSFTVNANEWRIRWRSKGGMFQAYLNGEGRVQVAADGHGAESEETYIHGAGTYYLSLIGQKDYDVWVEAQS